MFSEKIKHMIHINKIKQKDFACVIGVTPITVTRWCTGVSVPAEPMINLINRFFGITPSYFNDESDEPIYIHERSLADYSTDELLAELKRRTKV